MCINSVCGMCVRLCLSVSVCVCVCALEKEMATHSSVLAWRIPGVVEPGGDAVYGVPQSRT